MEKVNWLDRTEKLIGKDNINLLNNSHVVVFGLGGVGSYVVEGLVRSGIGNIAVIDNDTVDITNINRQLIADTSTIGMCKVDVEAERISKINPKSNIIKFKEFVNIDNLESLMKKIEKDFGIIDYVIDAIDTVSSKLEIIKYCNTHSIRIISCMGTGNKLNASKFEIADISKTSVCPLAKVIRKELRKLNIFHLKVLFSKEEIHSNSNPPASISFVPSVAGLLISGEVIKDLCN